jgi:8-hydroxy-5-deazaflavin:NADPH oxidoreductase
MRPRSASCALLGQRLQDRVEALDRLRGQAAESPVLQLRASHADREQAIDTLKAAFVQGRLAKDEFDARLGQAFASRTFAELAAVTGDIPAGSCHWGTSPPGSSLRREPRRRPARNDRPRPGVAAAMTAVGFIGSGNIGSTVARLSVAAGYDVIMSNSRGPHTLHDLVRELGAGARAATSEQAAAESDLAVVSIPLKAYRSIPAAPLAGKTVIDTCNYYPGRDGNFPELDDMSLTSSGLIQQHLAGAHVVKAFNNIFFRHLLSLARPPGAADRTFLPIAGDDENAKAEVTAFLDAIGYGTVDAGPLRESWRQEPGTPVYGAPYGTSTDLAGSPADEATIRTALAQASR